MEYRALRDCVLNTPSGPDHVKAGETRVLEGEVSKHWAPVGGMAPAAAEPAKPVKASKVNPDAPAAGVLA